jgi:acyl carrier protein
LGSSGLGRLLGEAAELGVNDSFLDWGIIDSTGILEIVMFLEQQFGVRVADSEMLFTASSCVPIEDGEVPRSRCRLNADIPRDIVDRADSPARKPADLNALSVSGWPKNSTVTEWHPDRLANQATRYHGAVAPASAPRAEITAGRARGARKAQTAEPPRKACRVTLTQRLKSEFVIEIEHCRCQAHLRAANHTADAVPASH